MERAGRVKHQVHFTGNWADVHTCALQGVPEVLIFDPYVARCLDVASPARFIGNFPSVVLFAYGDFTGSAGQDVLRLSRLGVRGVATRDLDDTPAALRLLLAEALSYSTGGEVLSALEEYLTPVILPVVKHLLLHGREDVTPEDLARFYCCHPKTLRKHLKDARFPPTQKLIAWVRLFFASRLLQDPGRTVEGVAFSLGFSSGPALHNSFQRYLGIRPRDIAARGGLQFLVTEFRRRCDLQHWYCEIQPVSGSRT